ncbi:MAG TPA: hypothetical protein VF316_14290, partial [Polyangiaceae bacterium]
GEAMSASDTAVLRGATGLRELGLGILFTEADLAAWRLAILPELSREERLRAETHRREMEVLAEAKAIIMRMKRTGEIAAWRRP